MRNLHGIQFKFEWLFVYIYPRDALINLRTLIILLKIFNIDLVLCISKLKFNYVLIVHALHVHNSLHSLHDDPVIRSLGVFTRKRR